MKAYTPIFITFLFSLNAEIPLFHRFPNIKHSIPHTTLCDLPTPIVKLDNFENYTGHPHIYMKRDDLTGMKIDDTFRLYGGNKPRKLEFLLADALDRDAHTVVTYGCAGSNHALATAVYSQYLGFDSILMLKNQPNSHVVRHNLLLDQVCNADMRFFPNNTERSLASAEILSQDQHAYLIPTGGSNTIGVLGFVNAALELAEQIKNNEMPEPDFIYIATGSCATTAGLVLGLTAAGLKAKIVAVCVEPEEVSDEFLLTIKRLFRETNELLNNADSLISLYDFPEDRLIINKKFCGTTYGLFIPEAIDAINRFKELERINLEGTYSAKPIAAIVDDAQNGVLTKDRVVLFWNTYCGIDYSHLFLPDDYKKLPQEFHIYFESDVQSC